MKRKSNNNLHKIKITGSNSINFINNCLSEDFKLENINRTSSKEIIFELNENDYKRLSKIDNRGCQIELLEMRGSKRLLQKLTYRIGLVIGLIISIIGVILINNRLLQIHIIGLTSTSKDSVIECLENVGIIKFSYMNYNIKELENTLAEEFNFSLVSIIKKGNSLVINVKEELPSIEDTYAPITADYNMVITSIEVFAGTQIAKSGDVIYKGDVLVEPYIKSGDSIVYVTPCANIVAEVFFSNSYVFKNNEEVVVRTGNKEIINSSIHLGQWNITNQSKDVNYSDYEVEEVTNTISNYFLPITIHKTYAYETTKTTVSRDFELEKDTIIENQKNELYSSIPNKFSIDNEDIAITQIADGYILNIYLMSTVNLRY